MADQTAYLRQVEDKLLSTDPQDVETVQLLKDEHERVRKGLAAAQPRAAAPALASGSPDRGGSTASAGDVPSVRTAGAVGVTAPAQALAGISDLGYAGLNWLAKKGGFSLGDEPNLTPQVDRLTDTLAGKPVGESVGRSMFEGGITGPLPGGKKAELISQIFGGAAAGGAGRAVHEAGGNAPAQIVAALLAGHGAGRVTANRNLSPQEILAKSMLQRATEGLSGDDFRTARAAKTTAAGEGVNLLPSQAVQAQAPGLENLQGAMLRSRASGGEGFRTETAKLPEQTRTLIERLKSMGGQTPRQDDMLADSVQRLSDEIAARGPKAVNKATEPLYNDPGVANKQFTRPVAEEALRNLRALQAKHWADPELMAAATQAEKEVTSLFFGKTPEVRSIGSGLVTSKITTQPKAPFHGVTPEELNTRLRYIRNGLPAYQDVSAQPSTEKRIKALVSSALGPLDNDLAAMAPTIPQAKRLQAELRDALPSDFSNEMRQARTTSGTEAALAAVEKRPDVLRQIAQENPLLAREVLQRQLDGAIARATATNPVSGLAPANKGVLLAKGLTEAGGTAAGKAFEQNLDLLLPGRPLAVEGFKRILDVGRNASRPTGSGSGGAEMSGVYEATKMTAGSSAQRVGAIARVHQATWGNLRDNATIAVLQRPDVIDRLEQIANMPKPRLTQAALLAVIPQLFEEPR